MIALLVLFKGNMIQCQPPDEGCSERQCAVAQEQHIKEAQPNACTQGSGVGESGTYTFATLARSDHCSPCPCPAVRVSPKHQESCGIPSASRSRVHACNSNLTHARKKTRMLTRSIMMAKNSPSARGVSKPRTHAQQTRKQQNQSRETR